MAHEQGRPQEEAPFEEQTLLAGDSMPSSGLLAAREVITKDRRVAKAGLACLMGGVLVLALCGRWTPTAAGEAHRPARTGDHLETVTVDVGLPAAPAVAPAAQVAVPAARTVTPAALGVAPAAPAVATAPKPCAPIGKDCRPSKCCGTPGFQCFEKNSGWASCRPWCAAGPDPTDANPAPWRCEPLGPKTPGVPPPPDYSIKKAAWVDSKCSPSGANCSATRCCKDPGSQCFLKAPGWAACKSECTPGPDPTDADDHPWKCKTLGMRTPGVSVHSLGRVQNWVAAKCSATGENCEKTGCCKDPGYQCYKKTDGWATCMDHCTKGPLLTDSDPSIWECKALGGRTPGVPKVFRNTKIAPWVKTKCSKPGENCNSTMCCADETMQCYTKNDGWASCMRGCFPGVHKGDPTGGKWDCKALGVRTPRKWGWPSLYCFSVVMLSSYEAGLMRQALRTNGGIGIFQCEMYDVFSQDGETWLGDGPNGQVRTHHFDKAMVIKSVDGTAGNMQLFMNVWSAVQWVGAYKLTDWTVKVDPDAVVLPDRLRGHLKDHTGQKAYIVNCNKPMATGPMMFGSLEAISKQALDVYFASGEACHNHYDWGEDRWMGDCLSKLGVAGVSDFNMVGDGVCLGNHECADGRAAYHPFKNDGAWINCYHTATR